MQVKLPYPEAVFPLIDLGVNFFDEAFADDLDDVLERAQLAGVTGMLLTGTDLTLSEKSLNLAHQYPHLLCSTAGVHPHQASEWTQTTAASLQALLAEPACVAVGETGLDFNRNFSTPADQQKAFEAQLGLAVETGKPLFIHERDAGVKMLEMLSAWRDSISGAVVHCFTGEKKTLFGYLDLDLYIGITGWVCDERRGTHLWPLLPSIPQNRLMIETDSPWLLPRNLKPRPKKYRNEPAYLPWVLQQVADLYQLPVEEVAEFTSRNAQQLFNLPAELLLPKERLKELSDKPRENK
ncbi:TatD family hydrolase [Marinospirillum insulare]|uniref:3'-5' ssDNA/RNA exonuclease TatD n=1 Tax=Marinospirillum insulare TaxID=217169 RepID=A0ABQ5ZZV1_9GAMM|nr:TatD family hydrolase [Marinospirillum insulare]GLR64201.1 3'-5' ssDNA/RNA exonuclease TatD [Marinospirillum insulare]